MKLIAKCDFLQGGRNIRQGQTLVVSEFDGYHLIASGYAEAVKEKKSKKKTAKNSEEG